MREPDLRAQLAADFSRLVRSLHGSPLPTWYGEHVIARRAALERALAGLPIKREH